MTPEQALIVRVLETLLREDVGGLRTGGALVAVPELDAGRWLATGDLLVPVSAGGFLADFSVRRPLLVDRERGALTWCVRLDDVLDAVAPHGDAEAEAGFAAFRAECGDALAALEVQDGCREPVLRRLAAGLAQDPGGARGLRGSLLADTLAAHLGHPLYPTSQARPGLTAADLRAYAPEFAPEFALRWVLLPRDAVVARGGLPAFWPQPDDPGRVAFPVHPVTAAGPLRAALREAGLSDRAAVVAAPWLEVRPTLSLRTVAVIEHPGVHLKLPLPTSTLGRRNRRTIKPGTLTDGALTQELLDGIRRREPGLRDQILLTDESTHAHAGHELLAFLLRRYPDGLDGARVVTVAALPAPLPDGRFVAQALADDFYGGDVVALLDAYLTLLFAWHITLWLRYGVALEAHQQNTSVVLDVHHGAPRMRLLLKDNDAARIDPAVLAAGLGRPAPGPFDDARILVTDPVELADVFTTITLHLCAAAVAVGLAERGGHTPAALLALVRRRLEDSLAPHAGARDLGLLRARVLDAARLPVKGMVTAATLLPKHRTGGGDVNKFLATTAPNYLGVRRVA